MDDLDENLDYGLVCLPTVVLQDLLRVCDKCSKDPFFRRLFQDGEHGMLLVCPGAGDALACYSWVEDCGDYVLHPGTEHCGIRMLRVAVSAAIKVRLSQLGIHNTDTGRTTKGSTAARPITIDLTGATPTKSLVSQQCVGLPATTVSSHPPLPRPQQQQRATAPNPVASPRLASFASSSTDASIRRGGRPPEATPGTSFQLPHGSSAGSGVGADTNTVQDLVCRRIMPTTPLTPTAPIRPRAAGPGSNSSGAAATRMHAQPHTYDFSDLDSDDSGSDNEGTVQHHSGWWRAVYAAQLKTLAAKGFTNTDENVRLLKIKKGHVGLVESALTSVSQRATPLALDNSGRSNSAGSDDDGRPFSDNSAGGGVCSSSDSDTNTAQKQRKRKRRRVPLALPGSSTGGAKQLPGTRNHE